VEQPAEKRSFADSIRIASYPARDYHGLIFAYLGGGDPPPFPLLDMLDDADGLIEARESRRPYPFFNQLENSVDETHFNFTHRTSDFTDAGLNNEIPEVSSEETEYGIVRYGKRGNAVRISHILMPNCMYASVYGHAKGWTDHFAWRVPVDRETHSTFGINLIHKKGAEVEEYHRALAREKAAMKTLEPADAIVARILAGDMHLDDVPSDRPDLLGIQDTVAMMAQGSAVDRERDMLGASDLQVRMLRQIWTREIRAMEEGQKMKDWRIPRGLAVTRGVDA
jgi:5,5'-dehydrodivanillate O-demethylase